MQQQADGWSDGWSEDLAEGLPEGFPDGFTHGWTETGSAVCAAGLTKDGGLTTHRNASTASNSRANPGILWSESQLTDSLMANAPHRRLPWLASAADTTVPQTAPPTARTHKQIPAETIPALLHDTRNMVAAMDLYCDLLDEPDVLAAPFRHYAEELRLVASASRRLMEQLAALEVPAGLPTISHPPGLSRSGRMQEIPAAQPIRRLADHLSASHNLLSALVGPAVTVGLTLAGGNRPISMASDDLTRVLVNLARNAAEVMPAGGHIQIALEESAEHLSLTFTDNGPGIPRSALETIFSPGYSSHVSVRSEAPGDVRSMASTWPVKHRGLGLSIVRALVSAAGGTIWATNQQDLPETNGSYQTSEAAAITGAVFVLEFPIASLPIPLRPRLDREEG